MNKNKMIWLFLLTFVSTLVSWRFLDIGIALTVMERINAFITLKHVTSNIPDALFLLVCICSSLFWGKYILLKHQGIINTQALFCENAGTSILLAYFLKWLLKLIFGRTNTRVWLESRTDGGFHWFHGGGNYSSFPSGHMAVFTAFFVTVWIFYPRYRLISVSMTIVLSVALIATDYHFLSDVIAGTYLGVCSAVLTTYYFEKDIMHNEP
jgi:membrane-associated phospholipid phosphatase